MGSEGIDLLRKLRGRRFWGLFWPIFDLNDGGNILMSILSLSFKSKIGSKEPENRQNLSYARGLMIHVHNLSKDFALGKKVIHAVENVSLSIQKGEILGLVGESGSGKSTLGKMLLRLIPPTSGQIFFQGEEITYKKEKRLCKKIQMIFQDPFASLNPRMTVEKILKEPTLIHNKKSRVDELLDLVGLPKNAKNRYPHEFSGGQRQRIGIARALALQPEFIVCDEPISALDVSMQAQIVHLLMQLQKELKLTLLFISHDLSVVRYISNRIAVMHQGKIIEIEDAEAIYTKPQHPYTKLLLSSTLLNLPSLQPETTC